jgi:membrane protein DedA with SNARE-associated domain
VSAGRIAAGVGAVAFLCLAVWRLRTGRPGRAALGGSLAAVLAFFASGGSLGLGSGETAVEDTAEAFGAWTYGFAGGMAFLETSIPPLTVVFPGEVGVLLSGSIAAVGEVSLIPLLGIVWACSALGDSFTFALGRRLGRPFLLRRGPSFGLTERRVNKVDHWLDRWGAPAVCFGRLLPLARPFGPFIAGSSRFRYRRFLLWNLLGTLLFTLVFGLLGYAFYNSYDQLTATVGKVAFAVLTVIIGAVIAIAVLRRRRQAA